MCPTRSHVWTDALRRTEHTCPRHIVCLCIGRAILMAWIVWAVVVVFVMRTALHALSLVENAPTELHLHVPKLHWISKSNHYGNFYEIFFCFVLLPGLSWICHRNKKHSDFSPSPCKIHLKKRKKNRLVAWFCFSFFFILVGTVHSSVYFMELSSKRRTSQKIIPLNKAADTLRVRHIQWITIDSILNKSAFFFLLLLVHIKNRYYFQLQRKRNRPDDFSR